MSDEKKTSNLERLVSEWDYSREEIQDFREVDSNNYRDFINAIKEADEEICPCGGTKMASHNCDVDIDFSIETEEDTEGFECYGIDYNQFTGCGCYCGITLKLRPIKAITEITEEENNDV